MSLEDRKKEQQMQRLQSNMCPTHLKPRKGCHLFYWQSSLNYYSLKILFTCCVKVLRRNVSYLFPSFRWLPVILCIPWPVAASLQLPPPPSHSLPCVCSVSLRPNLSLLVRHQSLDLVLHLSIVWPHLNLMTSAKTLYPNKVTFVGTRS